MGYNPFVANFANPEDDLAQRCTQKFSKRGVLKK